MLDKSKMLWISVLLFCIVHLIAAKNYSTSVAPLRWGFVGCGRITNNFAAAVESLPRSEHMLQAFASRNASRAEEYRKLFGGAKAYGSYEELAKDPAVDVVYIGTINPNHFEVANLMMDHGKHVLCEKPLTLKADEAVKLIERSQQLKLYFQEAVWSRFFPAYDRIRQELATLGEIKTVLVNKGQSSGFTSQRLYRKELGGGALKDIGGYAIQFALQVFGTEMPEKIASVSQLNNETIDTTTSLILQWKDGGIANLAVSTLAEMPNEAFIFGTNGSIKLPNSFMQPEHFEITRKSKSSTNTTKEKYPVPKVNHRLTYSGGASGGTGMVYEAQEVRRCIQDGLLESPHMTHKDTLATMNIQKEVLKQIGVNYDDLYMDGKYVGSPLNPIYDPV